MKPNLYVLSHAQMSRIGRPAKHSGMQIFAAMKQEIAHNNPTKAWDCYQKLLALRNQELTSTRQQPSQSGISSAYASSALANISNAHFEISKILTLKNYHNYNSSLVKHMRERLLVFLNESTKDGYILTGKQIRMMFRFFAATRDGIAADQVWQHLTLSGMVLDISHYHAYIHACIQAENYDRAFAMIREIRERGMASNSYTQGLLIRLYGMTGDLQTAKDEFARACRHSSFPAASASGGDAFKPDVPYWRDAIRDARLCHVNVHLCNEMLDVLGRNGLMDEMKRLFACVLGLDKAAGSVDEISKQQMLQGVGLRGIEPNIQTFHLMIKWYAMYWDMEEAVSYVHLMGRYGISPVPKTLKLLVNRTTASRDYKQCAEIAMMIHEKYATIVPNSVIHNIETYQAKAMDMEKQIREAESQKTSIFSSLTGISSSYEQK
ncbi:hypothetical protein EV183_003953 [Coemansia sp. RSA 2336]|nr:hypothetical protein EV183_003953 [Coemansia sp. RSA 2336]